MRAGTSAAASAPAAPVSAWSPLSQPVFRALWIASVASNIGTWMQSVGAAWLMTSLTPSPALVALLTTASSLPVFLLGLPAGALADVVDRRRLLLITQSWMLAAAAVLGVLTWLGLISAWGLLLLTFLLGLGGALNGPAWQAIVPELVPRKQLPQAVALNSAGFNLARAVGPALGGLVVAAAGSGAVFLLNAVSFLAVVIVIYRWHRRPRQSTTPPERIFGAMQAGVRYARNSPALQVVLIRTGIFIAAGSALWALLPVVARKELGLDATGYGVLLASIGLGAVAGAGILPRLRSTLSPDRLAIASTLAFALATLALAYLHNLYILNAALFLAGIAWIAIMSSMNVAVQTTSPAWVLARALGVYLLVFQGAMAAGGVIWGAVAERVGDPNALLWATIALVVGLAGALKWHLQTGQGLDLRPSLHWSMPEMVISPHPEDGPVLVTVQYRVPDENAEAFIDIMDDMGTVRRRDGAVRWNLFRDSTDANRFFETFLVPSWAEHLRQHERMTVADRALEERALSYMEPGAESVVSHYIAARSSDDND